MVTSPFISYISFQIQDFTKSHMIDNDEDL